LELGPRLGYCDRQLLVPVQRRLDEVGKMLNGLITSLQPPEDWQTNSARAKQRAPDYQLLTTNY
jgi:hypothetical protein